MLPNAAVAVIYPRIMKERRRKEEVARGAIEVVKEGNRYQQLTENENHDE